MGWVLWRDSVFCCFKDHTFMKMASHMPQKTRKQGDVCLVCREYISVIHCLSRQACGETMVSCFLLCTKLYEEDDVSSFMKRKVSLNRTNSIFPNMQNATFHLMDLLFFLPSDVTNGWDIRNRTSPVRAQTGDDPVPWGSCQNSLWTGFCQCPCHVKKLHWLKKTRVIYPINSARKQKMYDHRPLANGTSIFRE